MIGRAFDYLMLLDWRATELLVASLLIVRGGAILFAGGMSAATYDPFRTIMPDQGWGLVSIITGVFWIFAVKRNGHMHQSPALRASAGVFAVLVTGLLSFAFVIAGSANAASVYSVIFVFTMLAALRSMVDREKAACMIETIISALGSLTPEQITALGGVFLTLVFAALGIRAAPAIVRRTTNDGSTPTAATPDKDAVRQSLLIEQTHSGVQRIEMLLQKLL